MASSRVSVYVALPCRPGGADKLPLAALKTGRPDWVYDYRSRGLSLLTTNFNWLWCDALNERAKGITHFCMMHDDIAPEEGWLVELLGEMSRVGADVLSCCVAMKDPRGLSSTGVMDWSTRRMRKLSVAQCLKLPPTFTAEDVGPPGGALLMNTGLWVCDFTRPWVEKMVFRQLDAIVQQADGKFRPVSVSEDWLFSLDCARLGLKCCATTKVKVRHLGGFDYPNFVPWGNQQEGEPESDLAIAWNVNAPESWGLPPEPIGVPEQE